MAGIKTLAKRLDLSIGTVSRALNDKPDVSAETRKRVLGAAQELGYRPNHFGQSLRNGKTNTIGMTVSFGGAAALRGDNFFMQLVDSMQARVRESGYDLVMLPCHSTDDPVEFLERHIVRRSVDFLVITDTKPHDPRIELMVDRKTPFLALGRSLTPGTYPWVDLDFEGVAERAVKELVRLGHTRIAVAAPRRTVNLANVFIEGYRNALHDHGLPFDERLVFRVSSDENGGRNATDAMLKMENPPTAIMLGQEFMATGVYSGLQQAGLVPGRDMSIVGFRQNPQLEFLQPTLASFALDLKVFGQAVGDAVLAALDPARKPKNLLWKMDYVPGDSAQPPRKS